MIVMRDQLPAPPISIAMVKGGASCENIASHLAVVVERQCTPGQCLLPERLIGVLGKCAFIARDFVDVCAQQADRLPVFLRSRQLVPCLP
jgi:hypothetical protein